MSKPPLRVIAIAWGESYVEDFLEYCLPALIAPGNVPALTEHFDVTVVFVTEVAFFDLVRAHPTWRATERICGARLIEIDDLVATRGSYGMSVSYGLYRGFEDLGPAMTECYMLFINADFILADGSYRNMLPALLRGDPIVLAPSYCTISEEVRQELAGTRDAETRVLAMPHRRMAQLILEHRHYTIRGKTVNQRFYSHDYIDQFYLAVSESVLLGRQHPVAVVAMKPERHLTDLTSYWDYGVIAEFCPSLRFTVLGDSDEFLMLELRERDTAGNLLGLGWPEPSRIAASLKHILTGYTKAAGDWRLTLHSSDLPEDIEASHQELDRFAHSVYASLPAQLPGHLDHLQWRIHYQPFQEARRRFLEARRSATQRPKAVPAGSTGSMLGGARTDDDPPLESEEAILSNRPRTGSGRRADDLMAKVLRAHEDHLRRAQQLDREVKEAAVVLRRWMDVPEDAPDEPTLTREISTIGHRVTELQQNGEVVMAATRQFLQIHLDQSRAAVREIANLALAIESKRLRRSLDSADSQSPTRQVEQVTGLRKLSHVVFGSPGKYRPWHWLHSSSRHAFELMRQHLRPGSDLVLLYGGAGLFRVPEDAGRVVVSPVSAARSGVGLKESLNSGKSFDCCLIESDMAGLREFGEIYRQVRPLLRPGGVVIALFLSINRGTLPLRDAELIRTAFPACGPARIAWSGSRAAALAFRLRNGLSYRLVRNLRVPEALAVAISMAAAAPFALIATLVESGRTMDTGFNPPPGTTSAVIEIRAG